MCTPGAHLRKGALRPHYYYSIIIIIIASQSTSVELTAIQSSKQVTWCFTPSQPVWLYCGEIQSRKSTAFV